MNQLRPIRLLKIIFRHNRFTPINLIIKVLIQADSQERTRNIPYIFITISLQAADGIIAALSCAAMDINRDISWNLLHSLPELAERNKVGTLDMACIILGFLAYIDNIGPGLHQFTNLAHRNLAVTAFQQVCSN